MFFFWPVMIRSRKGTVNNSVMSGHFIDNERQIRYLSLKSLQKYTLNFL